jgi:hypothetical protein
MKLNSAISKFLTNKWVLNIIAFLALLNVIGYLVMGNLNAVIYFIIIAVLVRYFSKNMTIVLGVPLVLVNLLAIRGNVLEGMESGSGDRNGNTNGTTKPSTQNEQEKINKMVNNNTASTTSVINNSAASTISESPNNPAQDTGDKQGFEAGRRKNRGYDIDYATTIEDAYDELNNILGSDGIQRLTADSQNLMKQQMQLAEAMKGMTPVIKSIEPMVKNLQGMMGQMGDGKQGLGSIMNLAKKFADGAAPVK